MASPFDGWPIRVAIPVGLVVSLLVVWALDRPNGRWSARLRKRFLLGVPWGTLVSVTFVVGVYLFVQHGWEHWRNPVTVAFASWSYLYPLGVVLGPFSHAGPGHLLGNVTSTLAVAPLAEYYVGHYPTRRGEQSFGSWRTNPWLRAFVLFPLGVGVVGICTSLFAWGPIIGFSGVLFAFIGFALVRYPLGTVVALSAQGVVQTVYQALQSPLIVQGASASYSKPWWFGIAVQGHALGFFLGVVAGLLVLRFRDRAAPPALRTWTGTLLVATSLSLWALWWYRGVETYVLFRGLGIVFVLALATLVTFAVRTHDATSFGPGARQAGTVLVFVPLIVMAGVAAPVNLTTVQGDGNVEGVTGVQVRDYTVLYAEDVPNQKVSVVDVSVGGETTSVDTSGVIVVNEEREVWTREVTKGQLAFAGRRAVRVGGVGWAETVFARRIGWSAVGGGAAYQVWLRPADDGWRHAYASEPATADPVVAGMNVSIVPADDPRKNPFRLRLTNGSTTVASRPLPTANVTVSVEGVQFTRENGVIYARVDDTRVRVAKKESYN
ncbi:rhomboid family intramembrane serine protease [Halomicrococcus sp. NG-SE-24]|uniref:rhomboid family intramembrane serine protease n=1 Tax=Halomicrococcus sp. NG-SE-24 TaxID=3436928 RepID=UPI003D953945